MKPTVTLEIAAESAALVRQLLAFHDELQALALTAADGTVLDVCEAAVVQQGRELQNRLLADALAQRVAAAEKKGRRGAAARADNPKPTAGANPVSS
jgi:hypothetical protein